MSVNCFWMDELRITRYNLRRYRSSDDAKCLLPMGYHNAAGPVVGEAPDDPTKDYCGTNPPEISRDDPRWPKACGCGYIFKDSDQWQIFANGLYRRADTGQILTREEAPAGAMWNASWWPEKGIDGICLMVKLPGGSEWMVDGIASNCECRGQAKDPKHRCWVRSGKPPLVTANPSIQSPNYHGWLRNGVLVPA